jgi:hypothetical protein
MPQDIKIWEIESENNLKEIVKSSLDLEKKLETWIENDIRILSEEYLIIGRQVPTDFNKYVDLLCLDLNGDIVIVELKRDKTPRDVVAQTLDYASWVNDLSRDAIVTISKKYLSDSISLEKAFKDKFNVELPEFLNTNHSMVIVASVIDSSTERIVRYLSEKYGVGINVIQFQFHKHEKTGSEYLSRIFLLKPEMVKEKQGRIQNRKPNLSIDELERDADENGIGEIYSYLFKELLELFDTIHTTQSSVGFVGKNFMEDTKKSVIINLIPSQSDKDNGLKFQVYLLRIARYFKTDEKTIENLLPEGVTDWHFVGNLSPDGYGFEGYFKNKTNAQTFIHGLQNLNIE